MNDTLEPRDARAGGLTAFSAADLRPGDVYFDRNGQRLDLRHDGYYRVPLSDTTGRGERVYVSRGILNHLLADEGCTVHRDGVQIWPEVGA